MQALNARWCNPARLQNVHHARQLVLQRRSGAAGVCSSTLGANTTSGSTRSLRAGCQCTASASAEQQSTRGQDGASASGNAEPVSFEIQGIPGEGSCLFRALAAGQHLAETGRQLHDAELLRRGFALRQEVCDEMLRRREEVEPFISGVFDAYVSNMALEGIWGGEPELAVAVHCLRRPIIVYKQVRSGLFMKDLQKVSEYGAEEFPGVAPVCVLFSGAHYDLLVQLVN